MRPSSGLTAVTSVALVVALAVGCTQPSRDHTAHRRSLFGPATGTPTTTAAAEPGDDVVGLDAGTVTADPAELDVELAGGATATARRVRVERRGGDDLTWYGRTDGHDQPNVVVTVVAGQVVAYISSRIGAILAHTIGRRQGLRHRLRPDEINERTERPIDPGDDGGDDDGDHGDGDGHDHGEDDTDAIRPPETFAPPSTAVPTTAAPVTRPPTTVPTTAAPTTAAPTTAAPTTVAPTTRPVSSAPTTRPVVTTVPATSVAPGTGGTVVDVMVVHNQAVATRYPGAVPALAQSAVDRTNTALRDSRVDVRFRLVHVAQVPDAEIAVQGGSNIRGVQQSATVRTLRERYGADLVQAWGTYPSVCGQGYQSAGRGMPAAYGFSVVNATCVRGIATVHEWGHNLGGGHDRIADAGANRAGDAFGTLDRTTDVMTVMAYDRRDCPGGSCEQSNLFSTPDVRFKGKVVGVAGREDNARNIRLFAPGIAGYLPTRV